MKSTYRNAIAAAVLSCLALAGGPATAMDRPHAISVVSIPKDLLAFVLNEKKELVKAFGVTADVSWFEEGQGMNCVAFPDHPATVYLGINMIGKILSVGSAHKTTVDTVIQGVLAHEWAHLLQAAVRADGLGGKLAKVQSPMKLISGAQIEHQASARSPPSRTPGARSRRAGNTSPAA